MKTLNWPEEGVWDDAPVDTWSAPGSNRILDFHGDPQAAQLVVFSDGNHHMALRYVRIFPEVFEMIKLAAPAGDMENSGTSIHAGLIGDGGQWGRACLDFLFIPGVAEIYAAHGLDAIANP